MAKAKKKYKHEVRSTLSNSSISDKKATVHKSLNLDMKSFMTMKVLSEQISSQTKSIDVQNLCKVANAFDVNKLKAEKACLELSDCVSKYLASKLIGLVPVVLDSLPPLLSCPIKSIRVTCIRAILLLVQKVPFTSLLNRQKALAIGLQNALANEDEIIRMDAINLFEALCQIPGTFSEHFVVTMLSTYYSYASEFAEQFAKQMIYYDESFTVFEKILRKSPDSEILPRTSTFLAALSSCLASPESCIRRVVEKFVFVLAEKQLWPSLLASATRLAAGLHSAAVSRNADVVENARALCLKLLYYPEPLPRTICESFLIAHRNTVISDYSAFKTKVFKDLALAEELSFIVPFWPDEIYYKIFQHCAANKVSEYLNEMAVAFARCTPSDREWDISWKFVRFLLSTKNIKMSNAKTEVLHMLCRAIVLCNTETRTEAVSVLQSLLVEDEWPLIVAEQFMGHLISLVLSWGLRKEEACQIIARFENVVKDYEDKTLQNATYKFHEIFLQSYCRNCCISNEKKSMEDCQEEVEFDRTPLRSYFNSLLSFCQSYIKETETNTFMSVLCGSLSKYDVLRCIAEVIISVQHILLDSACSRDAASQTEISARLVINELFSTLKVVVLLRFLHNSAIKQRSSENKVWLKNVVQHLLITIMETVKRIVANSSEVEPIIEELFLTALTLQEKMDCMNMKLTELFALILEKCDRLSSLTDNSLEALRQCTVAALNRVVLLLCKDQLTADHSIFTVSNSASKQLAPFATAIFSSFYPYLECNAEQIAHSVRQQVVGELNDETATHRQLVRDLFVRLCSLHAAGDTGVREKNFLWAVLADVLEINSDHFGRTPALMKWCQEACFQMITSTAHGPECVRCLIQLLTPHPAMLDFVPPLTRDELVDAVMTKVTGLTEVEKRKAYQILLSK